SEKIQSLSACGERVRLRSVLHLKAVFHDPQKVVRGRKRRALVVREKPFLRKPGKHDQGLRGPDPRLASSVLKLERLRDELDFANASAPELHIESSGPSRSLPLYFFSHAPDRVYRIFSNVGGKNRIAHRFQKRCGHASAAGRSARSDQALALPVLRGAAVIVGRTSDVPHQIAVAPVRTKPEIDPVHRAFSCVASDHLDDALGYSCEELLVCYHRRGRASVTRG